MHEDEQVILAPVCLLLEWLYSVFGQRTCRCLRKIVREEVTTFIGIDAACSPLLLSQHGCWSFILLDHTLVLLSQFGVASHLRRLTNRYEAVRLRGSSGMLELSALKDHFGSDRAHGLADLTVCSLAIVEDFFDNDRLEVFGDRLASFWLHVLYG